jgi:hypothetical protein
MKSYENYLKAKRDYEQAKAYFALFNDRDCISGKSFIYSPCHSALKLTACGQHSSGGRNYHEAPEVLTKAVLESFDVRKIVAAGLERLEVAMKQALVDCKTEIGKVADEIRALESQDGFIAQSAADEELARLAS